MHLEEHFLRHALDEGGKMETTEGTVICMMMMMMLRESIWPRCTWEPNQLQEDLRFDVCTYANYKHYHSALQTISMLLQRNNLFSNSQHILIIQILLVVRVIDHENIQRILRYCIFSLKRCPLAS